MYERALDLYAGDLLPQDLYVEWANGRRDALRRRWLDLLTRLAALQEVRGAPGVAASLLERVVGAEPLEEEAHASLMRLYALSGRRHLAVRQYQQLCEVLSRELDAEPQEATTRLYERLLRGPAGAGGPLSSAAAPPAPTPILNAPSPSPSSGARPRHSLPAPLTSFVGRERDMQEVVHLLSAPDGEGARLLTLTGAGGAGKTRLAIEAGRRLLPAFPDGVWLVDLVPVTSASFVPRAVAGALGVDEAPGRDLSETLIRATSSRRLLLLLDNCEHVMDACARLIDDLLRAAPQVRVLATSQEAIGMGGETVRPVAPLPTPGLAEAHDLARLREYNSVELLMERARAACSGFSLTPDNAPDVARICRRLDGLPLALELAAARLRALAPGQLADALDDRFAVLCAGNRAAPPRHQGLRTLVDWSYDLLSATEQRLFDCLSAFPGTFSLDAATAVGAGLEAQPGEMLPLLSRLVDRSLVVAEPGLATAGDPAPRYRLLETLRLYGRERLAAGGEGETVQQRHAAFYLRLAEASDGAPGTPASAERLERLEREHDNLRQALSWLITRGDGPGRPAPRRRPGPLLARPGPLRRGRVVAERGPEGGKLRAPQERRTGAGRGLTVSDAPDVALRARALQEAGRLAYDRGDWASAADLSEAALALRRRHPEACTGSALAWTLTAVADARYQLGDTPRARALFAESVERFRQAGDGNGAGVALMYLGTVVRHQDGPAAARPLYEESMALLQAADDTSGVALAMDYLGRVARSEGDLPRAFTLQREALRRRWTLRHQKAIAISLRDLGALAALAGDHDRGVRLLAAATTLRRAIGSTPGTPPPDDQVAYERAEAEARARWAPPASPAPGRRASA